MKFMLSDVEVEPRGFIKFLYYPIEKSITQEQAELVGGDILYFLNDKYHDKNPNEEWPKIDREKRIKYHENQLKLLKSKNRITWNKHGTEVE
ncbi:hypothetical protein [Methanobacterium spitsbergense]|uniref:Uncharacterized protein n=1 Tax=Methanobacterium spitsbergense TaxID=2874285 RepID=A0A8T5URN1_9EURY|nr:hypothetical protein [Methanobacterium spitsbergense]MBZ2166344.1 hypothetical protein [Methanobacterium spitsbergense]